MKDQRTIIIEGKRYLWSLKRNEIYTDGRKIIVVLEGTSFSRLYINPYAHDFEIRPKSIANGIVEARKLGWNPEKNSGDIYLKSEDGNVFEISVN